uniref:NADH-ubiquinone oxidoreductase chain 6 n=1 Tax=Asota plana lacteata TaxID=1303795 RepID=A0A0E3D9X2_ASOPL|nr:NADH dehydrogenase subunit 6 [Asota plana]AHN52525.1 NADH dehydrogenase subunit 6 [Asota plana lacteata]UNP54609.1 NADH dehydrogenase subunit 6 [Asota plana]
MTKMMLSFMITFISLFMLFLNNPLSMGLMILIQTLLICLITGLMIKTYWFSYILFLTFMGGILVLFIYVCSIASNELFKPSFNTKLLFFSMIFMMIITQMYFFNNLTWMNFSFNSDMNIFNNYMFFYNENNINLSKLYNTQTFMIMMMLVIYLFITLIAIVKITNIFYGPIRSKI